MFSDNYDQAVGEDLAEAEWNQKVSKIAGWSAVGLSAVAGFFSAQTKQQTLKNQALSLEFAGTQADMLARDYEDQALTIISSGNDEISRRGMQAGQERAKQIVNTARRGVMLAAGSSAEVRASMDIVRKIEARTIRTNVRRQAQQARRAALNARLKGRMARLQAENLRGAAGAISPALVALGGAAQSLNQISTAFIK